MQAWLAARILPTPLGLVRAESGSWLQGASAGQSPSEAATSQPRGSDVPRISRWLD